MSSFAPFYGFRKNFTTNVIYTTVPGDHLVIGDDQVDNTELLRVAGGIRSDTAGYLELADGFLVPVSPNNSCRLRFNDLTNDLELSINGGAYFGIGVGNNEWTRNAITGAIYPTIITDDLIIGDTATVGTERIRSTGGIRTDTSGYVEFVDGNAVPVSPADTGRVRYNDATDTLQASLNGSPYADIVLEDTYCTQVNWHIDPIAGDNANDGLTALTPIRTFAEWTRRIDGRRVTVESYIYIHGTLAEPLYLINAQFDLPLNIIGDTTVIYSGGITGITDWDVGSTPGVAGDLTDAALIGTWNNSGPLGSSLIDHMMIMTSGASNGYYSWIFKDQGGKTARFSQFTDPTIVSTIQASPGAGDTYNMVSLTELTVGVLEIGGTGDTVYFRNIKFSNTVVQTFNVTTDFGYCHFNTYGIIGASEHGSHIVSSCLISSEQINYTSVFYFNTIFKHKLSIRNGYYTDVDACVMQAGNVNTSIELMSRGCLYIWAGTWVAALDCSADALGCAGTAIIEGRLWGLAQTGTAIKMYAGARLHYTDSDNATAHLDIDGIGITEVNVAGDVKLYADLGLVGYVNLNNLTMAVPRVMDVL